MVWDNPEEQPEINPEEKVKEGAKRAYDYGGEKSKKKLMDMAEKRMAKETEEELTKKGAEKTGKEIAKKGAEKTAKEVAKKAGEEVVEDAAGAATGGTAKVAAKAIEIGLKAASKGAEKIGISKKTQWSCAIGAASFNLISSCLITILVWALIGAAVSGFFGGASSGSSGSAGNINVPCVRQQGPTQCGRASTAMVVRFWRPDMPDWYPDTADIGNQVRQYTNKNYVDAGDASTDNFQAIIKSLQAGNPVIIATSFYRGENNPYGHIFVLTGYDSATDTFFYNDTFWDEGTDCHKTTTKTELGSSLDHIDGRWYLYIPN